MQVPRVIMKRGIYINGTKYEQLSTSSVNRSDKPVFDSITYPFRVGNYDVGTYNNQATLSCKNLRIYAMRVWHQQLTSSQITTLYNAGPQASTLTTSPTVVTRGSGGGGGLPEGTINFKYQPFDYTLTANENFYCVGADKVNFNFKIDPTLGSNYVSSSHDSLNFSRLEFFLYDKNNNTRILANNNNTATFAIDPTATNGYKWDTDTNKTSLDSKYEHYFIVGPIGNTNSYYFKNSDGPNYNTNWNMSWFSGNGSSDVYSHIFAVSLDSIDRRFYIVSCDICLEW